MVRLTTKPSPDRKCVKCQSDIPESLRADAAYCGKKCRNAAEKARYCSRNPEYVARQRRLSLQIRHEGLYGHTFFIDKPQMNPRDRFGFARSVGFRSGLEVKVSAQLKALGIDPRYEKVKLKYTKPAFEHTYTADFQLPNGIIVETKGLLDAKDRQKMVLVKAQNPEFDIRFVFQGDPLKKFIYKGSPTSYAKWCEKNGFLWAGGGQIPEAWLKEKTT